MGIKPLQIEAIWSQSLGLKEVALQVSPYLGRLSWCRPTLGWPSKNSRTLGWLAKGSYGVGRPPKVNSGLGQMGECH